MLDDNVILDIWNMIWQSRGYLQAKASALKHRKKNSIWLKLLIMRPTTSVLKYKLHKKIKALKIGLYINVKCQKSEKAQIQYLTCQTY